MESYIKTRTGANFYMNDGDVKYHLLLGQNNIPELMWLLERAVISSDIETQFDFAVLKSKLSGKDNRSNLTDDELRRFADLGSKRAESIVKNKNLTLSNKNSNLETVFKSIQNSAESGDPYSAARLAIIYLRWLPYGDNHPDTSFFRLIEPNNQKGLYWLKRYASYPYAGDGNASCKLADEYYTGEIIKQNKKQAYLLYLESAFAGWGVNDCALDGLRKMAYAGDLDRFDKKLPDLIKSGSDNQSRLYISNLNGK